MPFVDLSKYPSVKSAKKNTSGSGKDWLALLNHELTFGNPEWADKKKENLYLELSSLLQAGINLKSSLELITADQQNDKDQELLQNIQVAVVNGQPFSKALEQSGKFSLYEIFSLQIGEETGKITEVLRDMAAFYQHKIKQRRKITGAMTYPCIVLCTSAGAVFFMLNFIVPMFGDIFKRFGGHLPWITQKIIAVSELLQHGFWGFTAAVLALSVLTFSFRKHEKFRRLSTHMLLKLPLIGNLVQKIYLARMCNSLRLLISARLPLLRAITLIRQMISFYPLEASLKIVEHNIMQGMPLHQSLHQFSVYPAKLIQLVKVGEETNQLDYFFGKIAEQYIDEVEYKTAALSSMMEPFIIIFLGLIVGVILISMYLPLFEMSNSFQ